ncbi:MAG: aminotransferase class I/II-fold pyridoxal phosphate-dependent enzyme [Geminicoccaceae bacterium]|nr:aminotransferase class I/II-fold pyridoxal phosphate-dependent enzyme [Geminicoccaceae bacterium]MCX8100402.1 aminotransferase class I/II-fold pyridoxal phosphate-dependent enzyme [Geminicoccaceae bacterium]
MTPIAIDLYSDTRTKPVPAMRRAMAEAEVDDEQAFLDPEVNALCEEVAALLGKEAAVFLPSGTMCNQIAFCVHCARGEEVLLDRSAHPIHAEAGGPAAWAGVVLTPLDGDRGIFTAEQVAARVRTNRHAPRTRLVSIEQTANLAGGTIWPLERIEAVAATARGRGLLLHMDGARLMNAVVATGVSAAAFCAPFDSCWLDFSKGLGAPVGAVLAGSATFVAEAWRYKQMMGGAMRQAGVLAAACRWALRHHVERLAEDHANARALAAGLSELSGIRLENPEVETNIVFFAITRPGLDAPGFVARLEREGVRMGAMGPQRVRAVTHLGVDRAAIDRALAAVRRVLAQARAEPG